jgi:hypothetical protein
MDTQLQTESTPSRREPSYAVLRELKARGFVSCVTTDGQIMVTADEPLSDEPSGLAE